MNQGVIAPGNHWIIDSLRGAPPRRPGWLKGTVSDFKCIPRCFKHRENPLSRGEGGPEGVGRGMRAVSVSIRIIHRPPLAFESRPRSRSMMLSRPLGFCPNSSSDPLFPHFVRAGHLPPGGRDFEAFGFFRSELALYQLAVHRRGQCRPPYRM